MGIYVTSRDGMGAVSEDSPGVFSTTGMQEGDYMHMASDFLSQAGVHSVTDGDFEVSESGTPGQSVDVVAGTCYVENSAFAKNSGLTKFWRVESDDTEVVTINPNVSGNPRIDIICVKVDTAVSPDDDASNVATIVAVEGTPAGSPSAPATPADHLKLAEVQVDNGFVTIVDADITDFRQETSLIGSVVDDGWTADTNTWTYASAGTFTNTNTTRDGTFTISGDVTGQLFKGMRVKFTQSTGGVKYGIITNAAYSAPNTTVRIFLGTDYTLNNEAISSPYYSFAKAPAGFPLEVEKWTIRKTDSSDVTQASPAAGTWYNLGSLSLVTPIGSWRLGYLVNISPRDTSSTAEIAQKVTLSKANNTEDDADFSSQADLADTASTTGTKLFVCPATKFKNTTITSSSTYYLNSKTDIASMATNGNLYYRGAAGGNTIIEAICAYL